MGREQRPSQLAGALAQIGDRWTLLVVAALLGGPRRFNELLQELPGIAPNILSDRLKRLEREALVVAQPYSTRPLRLGYELTSEGNELAGALRLLEDWGARRSGRGDFVRHGPCGSPMELSWHCPTCLETLHGDETDDVQFL